MNKEQADGILKAINGELDALKYDSGERIMVQAYTLTLLSILDKFNAPILDPYFLTSMRILANTLDLVHQIDKERK